MASGGSFPIPMVAGKAPAKDRSLAANPVVVGSCEQPVIPTGGPQGKGAPDIWLTTPQFRTQEEHPGPVGYGGRTYREGLILVGVPNLGISLAGEGKLG